MLRGIAQILQDDVRRDELAARFGGEEFTVVLPETDLAGAIVVCERIRETVAVHTFRDNDRDINVTVSVGLAGVGPFSGDYPGVKSRFARGRPRRWCSPRLRDVPETSQIFFQIPFPASAGLRR